MYIQLVWPVDRWKNKEMHMCEHMCPPTHAQKCRGGGLLYFELGVGWCSYDASTMYYFLFSVSYSPSSLFFITGKRKINIPRLTALENLNGSYYIQQYCFITVLSRISFHFENISASLNFKSLTQFNERVDGTNVQVITNYYKVRSYEIFLVLFSSSCTSMRSFLLSHIRLCTGALLPRGKL